MDVMATWKNWFDHWFFSDSTNSGQIQKIIWEMIQEILSEMSLDVIVWTPQISSLLVEVLPPQQTFMIFLCLFNKGLRTKKRKEP